MPLPNSIQGQYTVRRSLDVLDKITASHVSADNIVGSTISNADGKLSIRDLVVSDNIHNKVQISKDRGIYTIEVDDNEVVFPIAKDDVDGSISLLYDEPLITTQNGLSIAHDSTLGVTDDGLLTVTPHELVGNLPIVIDEQNDINLAYDQTLETIDGQLHVVDSRLVAPITRDSNGAIALDFGKGLDEKDGVLVTNIDDVVKPLGALSTGNILDVTLNEALDYGFNSLSELTGDVPDTEMTVLKLKASDDFSQKAGTLTIKSAGNQRIPYYGVLDGFNTRDTFQFNDTLSTLSVPHVSLNQNFNPDSNEAVTQSYVSQYIQSGSAIDVAAEANNRRVLNIRTDASLAVDGNNNVGVNPSAIVDNKTTRVVDGKISNGITFQPTFGLALENQNMAKLKPTVAGAITFTNENTIGESLTASKGVQRVENDFSLNLTSSNSGILVDNEAGSITLDLVGSEHIEITDNKISTDLRPYSAGENITISNNTISATVPEGNTYTAGPGLSLVGTEFVNSMNITAGLGIIVAGSAETGYIISSESLKTEKKDDEDDKTTDDDTEQTLEATNSNPEVVEAIGAIASLVPLGLTPLAGLGAIGAAPVGAIGGLYGLLGGLAAVAGSGALFGTLWGYQKERRTQKNPDGSVVQDESGNPVYDLTPSGDWQFDPADGTNIAIVEDKTTRKSRLLFDSIELPTNAEQAMNFGMCWDFEDNISRPWTIDT
ncbi:hypothetical protein HDU88_008756, partial [Geranomyces variabilis]